MRIKIGGTAVEKSWLGIKRLLMMAVACGVMTAGANLYFLTRTTGKVRTILKAQKEIEAGSVVTRDDFTEFKIRSVEPDFKGIFIEADDFAAYEKRSISVSLRKGDPLLLQSFDRISQIEVPAGKRLVPIKVQNEEEAIGYLIRPGNLVDLFGWINGAQHKLASNLCVAAIGNLPHTPRNEGDKEINYSSISVLIDEKDVESLNHNLYLSQTLRLTRAGNCEPGITPRIEAKVAVASPAAIN